MKSISAALGQPLLIRHTACRIPALPRLATAGAMGAAHASTKPHQSTIGSSGHVPMGGVHLGPHLLSRLDVTPLVVRGIMTSPRSPALR
jgi:hypothetical protein